MATEVKIPDIGDYKDVPIIEVHVKEGDPVNADDPLVSLESDKATMEVPAPSAGIVEKLLIKLGDKVSEGYPIVLLKDGDATVPEPPSLIEQQEPTPPPSRAPSPPAAVATKPNGQGAQSDFGQVHASPSVRRLARELDIDLTTIRGTGEKGRITKDDVKVALRGPAAPASAPAPAGGMGIPEIPAVDFSKFGPTETRPLPRIKKISGPHLHRAWLNVPLVTHQDEADITETDVYRKDLDAAAKDKGYRVTLLAFLMKASVSALKQFPEFNASLSPEKDSSDPQAVLPYRGCGRHAGRLGRACDPRCRSQRHRRHQPGTWGGVEEGPRRQARGRRYAGRLLHDLEPRRDWRHGVHAARQRARGCDPGGRALPDGAGLGWRDLPAAPDAAAVGVLRPPRDRRSAGGPVHAPSRSCAGGCSPPGLC